MLYYTITITITFTFTITMLYWTTEAFCEAARTHFAGCGGARVVCGRLEEQCCY